MLCYNGAYLYLRRRFKVIRIGFALAFLVSFLLSPWAWRAVRAAWRGGRERERREVMEGGVKERERERERGQARRENAERKLRN